MNYNQTEIYLKNEMIFCGVNINAIIEFVTPAMTIKATLTFLKICCDVYLWVSFV